MSMQRASVCGRNCVWGRVTKLALIYCLCQGGCKKEAQLPNLHKCSLLLPPPCHLLPVAHKCKGEKAFNSNLTENELTRECKWRRLFEVRWIYAAALLDQMSTYPAAAHSLYPSLTLSLTLNCISC